MPEGCHHTPPLDLDEPIEYIAAHVGDPQRPKETVKETSRQSGEDREGDGMGADPFPAPLHRDRQAPLS
jgi:hypothetical protein